jgi:hypothetical protein
MAPAPEDVDAAERAVDCATDREPVCEPFLDALLPLDAERVRAFAPLTDFVDFAVADFLFVAVLPADF